MMVVAMIGLISTAVTSRLPEANDQRFRAGAHAIDQAGALGGKLRAVGRREMVQIEL
jgi:hypothetical protein